jgi:hypothetical protein
VQLDELYVTPPDRFVAVRNALAKTHPDVRKLRRPSASAWLLNVLAQQRPKALEAVFRAGDALRAAQHRVLGGDDPEKLQQATRDVRNAIGKALDESRAVLAENGRREDAALLRKLSSILRSASVDPRVRDAVRSGRLLADPGDDEDEFLAELADAPRPKPTKKHAAPKKSPRDDREAKARAERQAKAKAALDEATRAEEEAKRARIAAEHDVRRARRALEEAKGALGDADARLTAAKRHREAAQRSLERTRSSRER